MPKRNKTTLTIRITVDSDVKDCYELRDAVAASILGIKASMGSEIDDTRTFDFLICEVNMPKAGKYGLLPSKNPAQVKPVA